MRRSRFQGTKVLQLRKLSEVWQSLKRLKTERSAMHDRKDIKLASMIIALRKKICQQDLIEQWRHKRNVDLSQDKAAGTSHGATSKRVVQNIKDTHPSTVIPDRLSATSEPDKVSFFQYTERQNLYLCTNSKGSLHKERTSAAKALHNGFKKHSCVIPKTGWLTWGFHSDRITPLPVPYSR